MSKIIKFYYRYKPKNGLYGYDIHHKFIIENIMVTLYVKSLITYIYAFPNDDYEVYFTINNNKLDYIYKPCILDVDNEIMNIISNKFNIYLIKDIYYLKSNEYIDIYDNKIYNILLLLLPKNKNLIAIIKYNILYIINLPSIIYELWIKFILPVFNHRYICCSLNE